LSHNSFGKQFVVTCFGESHGRCVGVLIDGCPPGIQLSIESIQQALNKRKPSNNALFTPRREEDTVDILAGIQNNITTGAPLCMLVWNKNISILNHMKYCDGPHGLATPITLLTSDTMALMIIVEVADSPDDSPRPS
jgi:chorismate synthase